MGEYINPEAELQRLALLSPVDYDRERKAAANRLGIRVETLDAEVLKLRPANANPNPHGSSTSGILEAVTPWGEPVDGSALLAEIYAFLGKFMVLPPGAATAISLWVLFAHAHEAAEHSPMLAIESPEKRCGKTTLLLIVSQLVPVPLPAANITAPAIFRSIEKFGPTLLLDEVETFIRDNEAMRGVLDSGFTKLSAFVIRTEGEDFEPRPFSTWCPKVVALIGVLPDTLQDRSIVLTLRRRLANERTERFNSRHYGNLHILSSKAARWAADNLVHLRSADPEMPAGLNDRAEDCWRPLLAVADAAGGDWPKTGRDAALVLANDDEANASVGALLLTHIRQLFAARSEATIQSSHLVNSLTENENWPWGEWRHGNPITAHGVARILRRFGIAPRKGRLANQYEAADFKDPWQRYLPSSADATPVASSTSSTNQKKTSDYSNIGAIQAGFGSSTAKQDVEVAEIAEKPVFSRFVEPVEVANGGLAGGKADGHAIDGDDDIIEGRT